MGGGPDNAKDACISELTNYAPTVTRVILAVGVARNDSDLAPPAELFQLLFEESEAVA